MNGTSSRPSRRAQVAHGAWSEGVHLPSLSKRDGAALRVPRPGAAAPAFGSTEAGARGSSASLLGEAELRRGSSAASEERASGDGSSAPPSGRASTRQSQGGSRRRSMHYEFGVSAALARGPFWRTLPLLQETRPRPLSPPTRPRLGPARRTELIEVAHRTVLHNGSGKDLLLRQVGIRRDPPRSAENSPRFAEISRISCLLAAD